MAPSSANGTDGNNQTALDVAKAADVLERKDTHQLEQEVCITPKQLFYKSKTTWRFSNDYFKIFCFTNTWVNDLIACDM